MTSADLLYTPAGTLVSGLEVDGLELVAAWIEFGGLRRQLPIGRVTQDDAEAFAFVDLAGKAWTLRPYDPDAYRIRTGVELGSLDDARAAYVASLDVADSAKGVAADRMDKFTWSSDELADLTIVKRST
jgi:hypothetical protein